MNRKLVLGVLCIAALAVGPLLVRAGQVSVTHTFTNGNLADATQINRNFSDLVAATSAKTTYANAAAATADGVVMWFKLDGSVVDAMGTFSGTGYGTNPVPGMQGGALDRRTDPTNGIELNLGTSTYSTFTFAFWWRPHDMTYYAATDGAGIVWLTNDATARVIGMNGMAFTNNLRWGNFPHSTSTNTGWALQVDDWVHMVLTVSGGTTSTLYVNGVPAASDSTYSWAMGPKVWLANYSRHGGNTNPHFGRGAFDEVVGWNRALTAAEVRSFYAEQRRGAPLF